MKTLILLIYLFIITAFLNANSLEKVSLQLQWKHQFQFAGYYIAKEKGFYIEKGLNVDIRELKRGINTTDEILNKNANFAIGRASLIVDKAKGKDVVLLNSVFQSSPLVLLTTQVDKIKTLQDFPNKRVMLVDDTLQNTAIKAMILSQGISFDDIVKQKHSFDLNDLINKKTDLITSYISNEPFTLNQKSIPYRAFFPQDYGYDFYSDLLFTSKDEIINNPKRVKDFNEASLKGWKYAFSNIGETVDLILKKYNTQNKSKEALLFEAIELKKLAQLNSFELGSIEKERLRLIYDVYHLLGVVKNDLNIEDLLYEDNLKDKVLFSKEELEYLEIKKELHMCIDPDWLPFEKIEDDKHIGMSSDYINIFREKLGIPIKLVNTKNWLETMEYGKARKCDFITMMSENQERKKDFNFSEPLMKMPIVVATTNEKPFINDLSGILDKKIAIAKGFAYSKVLKEQYPSIKLVEVRGALAGLSKVKSGEVYGFVGILPAIGYNIQENFIGALKITGKLDDSWNFPMASRNDEPILNNILNKLVNSVSLKENQEILNKWLSIRYEETIDFTKLLILSLFFIIIIVIILIKNNSIKKINIKLEEYIKVVDENVLTSSTDLNGNITYVSQAFCDISGYTKEELIGNNHRLIRHEDMPKELFIELWNTVKNGKTWKGELKNKRRDGSFYWIKATISPNFNKNKQIIGYTAIRHDISDKKRIEEISITDGLTNIYNRRYFNDISQKYVNSAKRRNEYIAFLMMDVDHFKEYNDNYGHQLGDEVLISIAKVLKEKTNRADDFCFRLGGEEFGLLFKVEDKEKALFYSNLIKSSIENLKIEHKKNSASNYITVSMGLYCDYAEELGTFSTVFKDADELLYKSKDEGRNKISVN